MPMSQPLQVVAPPDLRERIVDIAKAEQISQAQVVRDILSEGISKRESKSQRRRARRV